MKLNKLLPIVALSGIATVATPLVVSCSPKEQESIKFNIGSQTTGETVARLSVDWEPSEDSIIINNFNATCETIAISSCTPVGGTEARPYEVDLTFESDLNQELDNVVVEFDYEDKTQKISNHAKLENIHVDKYEEEDGIKLDTWSQIGETTNYIVSTGDNYFDVVENQEYTFLVDWTGYPSEETHSHFAISIAPQEQNSGLPWDQTSIYAEIGGVVLHEFTGQETDSDAWFCDGDNLICLPKNTISKNTKIIIRAKFTNGSTNCVATGDLTNGL